MLTEAEPVFPAAASSNMFTVKAYKTINAFTSINATKHKINT